MSLDADDISRLYRSHARAMLTFFARRTYDPETAVDLVAETFAAAFASRHQFRGDSDEEAGAWVYGIARHQLSALFRKGQVERRALSRLEVERRALTDPEYERIEQLADIAELRNLVADRLAELPAEHRRIVGLRIVEERSYADIAAALDISEQTARARVSRALRALAVQLEAAPQADVEVTDRG